MDEKKDNIYEYIKTLKVLVSLEDDYGHLTLRNVADRFRARIKYLTENIININNKTKSD